MATIVSALSLAAERALFSCNDRALWNFFSARRLFWVVSKTMCVWAKTTENMDKIQLYFQQKREKLAYRYFFSMSDEESRSVPKRMWKITSGVLIVFFLRIALKRPYNKQLINLVRLVITGKSQTSALMYWPRYRSVNTSRPWSEISL